MEDSIILREAVHGDLEGVLKFLKPFMDDKLLLPRTSLELELLLKHAFVALDNSGDDEPAVIGFAALEIYSKKLAEIQCLAVSAEYRLKGIGRELVNRCVARSQEEKVLELMAISSSEELFRICGFDYSLPNQKRAFFLQTRDEE